MYKNSCSSSILTENTLRAHYSAQSIDSFFTVGLIPNTLWEKWELFKFRADGKHSNYCAVMV